MGSSPSSRVALRALIGGVMIVILGFLLQKAEAMPATTRRTSAPTQPASIQLVVDGSKPIATVGDEFICATIDWWPPTKCDYGSCSWYNSSMLNLDLTNPILEKAVEALAPLKIRLGGTLEDVIEYDIGSLLDPCLPQLVANSSALFGFNGGCLSMQRWDLLNQFLKQTGASAAFGLNVLYGRSSNGTWDPSNAAEFIRYTHDQGYPVTAWELGNELMGAGAIGLEITPKNYSDDVKMLRTIVNRIYEHDSVKPLVVSPDSFYDVGNPDYPNFLGDSGPYVVNVVTRHLYNLGPGNTSTDQLVGTILNRVNEEGEEGTYAGLQTILGGYPGASAWVGEAGGAFNSGHENVTDSFIMAFWYLDQLGLASKHNNQAFCRQTLIGGHYGLLDAITYLPNPDFYGALLWQELMGYNVLAVNINSTDIQAYAHCQKKSTKIVFARTTIHQLDAVVVAPTCREMISDHLGLFGKSYTRFGELCNEEESIPASGREFRRLSFLVRRQSDKVVPNGVLLNELHELTQYGIPCAFANAICGEGGVTVLLLNYSNETAYSVNLTVLSQTCEDSQGQQKTRVPPEAPDALPQLEYHMSPEGGDIHSHVVMLNGTPLHLTSSGGIPKIEGLAVNGSTPITLEPLTYSFVVLQGWSAAACLNS